MAAHRCLICGRALDRADDPLSVDCGGDCFGCIVEAEDGRSAPDLPVDELRAWLEQRRERERALWEAAARRLT